MNKINLYHILLGVFLFVACVLGFGIARTLSLPSDGFGGIAQSVEAGFLFILILISAVPALIARTFMRRAEGKPFWGSVIVLASVVIVVSCLTILAATWYMVEVYPQEKRSKEEIRETRTPGVKLTKVFFQELDPLVQVQGRSLPLSTLVVVLNEAKNADSCNPTSPGVIGSVEYTPPPAGAGVYGSSNIPINGIPNSSQTRYIIRACVNSAKVAESEEFTFARLENEPPRIEYIRDYLPYGFKDKNLRAIGLGWENLPKTGTLVVVQMGEGYAQSCNSTDPGVIGSLPYTEVSHYSEHPKRKYIVVSPVVPTGMLHVIRACVDGERIVDSDGFSFSPIERLFEVDLNGS